MWTPLLSSLENVLSLIWVHAFFFHMLKLNYVPFTLLIFYVFVDCSSIYVYSVVCKCISDLPPVVCNGNPGPAQGKYSIAMNKCRFLNSCENVIPWFNCFAWNIKLWGPNFYHSFMHLFYISPKNFKIHDMCFS